MVIAPRSGRRLPICSLRGSADVHGVVSDVHRLTWLVPGSGDHRWLQGVGLMQRRHAVVLGAGVAGLLTARVLSDSFDSVSIVERDTLDANGDPRRGVPQGRQVHVLLPSGKQIL